MRAFPYGAAPQRPERRRTSAYRGSVIQYGDALLEVMEIGPFATQPDAAPVMFRARSQGGKLSPGTILETRWGRCEVVR